MKSQIEEDEELEARHRALQALQSKCAELGVGASCGASAGLYLAALAARSIELDRERFVELAGLVWDDLEHQQSGRPQN